MQHDDTAVKIHPVRPADYPRVIAVIDAWWGGRQMAPMLPRFFFDHFTDTCFAAELDGGLVGFLAGFASQSRPGEAYVHLIGVSPGERGNGTGQQLYEQFFAAVRAKGCGLVRAVTTPANQGSVAFHRKMGFLAEQGDAHASGGQDRVHLVKVLAI